VLVGFLIKSLSIRALVLVLEVIVCDDQGEYVGNYSLALFSEKGLHISLSAKRACWHLNKSAAIMNAE
jgi:hypothetical protein